MAKHFVAVCVVCLLCADHLPCKTHVEGLSATAAGIEYGNEGDYFSRVVHSDMSIGGAAVVVGGQGATLAERGRHPAAHTRRKRHTHHQPHEDETTEAAAAPINENSRRYIERIFEKFGNGEEQTMDLTGFESMLEHLGLTNLLGPQHEEDDKTQNNSVSTYMGT